MYINKEQRWGGADDVQVSSKTDLRIHKTKGWGGVGWGGGDKFLHIERKITSLVHSHPPSHYICKHVFLPTT